MRVKSALATALVVVVAGFAVTTAAVATAKLRGDRELGAHIARECVTCHQATGRVVGHVPMIIAWPEDQFIAVMNAYRSEDRENAVMRAIAAKLTDEEIAGLAAYFGGLPPQPKIN